MLNIAALRQQQIPLAAEPRSPVPFHILMKPIGPACNLACRYCYYPQDETPVNKMDDARLEQFIRRYIAAQPAGAREINFVWQGGEPLLAGLSFYKSARPAGALCPRRRHHQQQPADQRHADQRRLVPAVPRTSLYYRLEPRRQRSAAGPPSSG
jgi:hypothetical protein